jgi:hypothetical protein
MLVEAARFGGTLLGNYRLYRLDGAGKITNAEWIEAPADDEALVEARARAQSGSFELWEKNRLVERFRPGSADGS